MEKLLQEREFKAFIHSFSEGIVLTDAVHSFCWINPRGEELLAVSAEAWTGKSTENLLKERQDLRWIFTPKDPGGHMQCWKVMECSLTDCPLHGKTFTDCWSQKECPLCTADPQEGEEPKTVHGKCAHCKIYNSYIFHREEKVKRPGAESIVLHSHTTPLYDEDGTILGNIYLLRDVTRDRDMGRRKDEFFGVLSHELRSPLTSIRSYTEILLHYADTDPETQKEFLRIIHRESERLDQMIDDMDEVNRLESARAVWNNKEISLSQVVHKILQDHQQTLARKQIQCQTDMAPSCPKIWSDPDKIYHVVSTLIRNLSNQTPKNGTIKIDAFPMKGQRKNDSELFLKCTISNIPLPPSEDSPPRQDGAAPEASPSEEPRERKKALGLGFLLCKAILDQSGGHLWIENGESSAGYTFHFTMPSNIPLGSTEVEGSPVEGIQQEKDVITPPEVLPSIQKSKKRVLIVDDDPSQVNSLTFALTKEGYRVYSTTSPLRALEMVRESKPDLIISDIRMPEMDGYSFFKQLQQEESTKMIPFIFISAPKDIGERIRGLKSGVDDYLYKPYDLKELAARVEQLLGRAERHEDLSRLDSLTGALTRKAFEDSLTREMRKAQREKTPLALVMADLDHFKKINDTHGHLVGDFVLRSLVEFLHKNLRDDMDILARYGGEEFCIIMPGTQKQAARETLERIRKQLAETRFHYEKENLPIGITCSFGVSGFPSDSAVGRGLIEKSDIALYQAKNLGRNRVVLYDKKTPVPDS